MCEISCRINIRCPGCSAVTSFSLIEPRYEGPFRCWKCRATFIATIENGDLKSSRHASEDEFEQYEKSPPSDKSQNGC